ncbi:MAG TPA: sugar ABC transporter permease [Anaerolineaceae bacterium]|nr:sugar ABC transporter permease [Anaerolineaceae bacterium]HQH84400.1 sugar ABC transporter permease [Anaerolineaceae bacterium]
MPPATRSRASVIARVKENLTAYLFILPAFLIIGVFGLFPIGYAIYMSLFNWRVTKGEFAVDPSNFTRALGDWTGVGLFLAGVALLVLAYWVWNNAFKAQKRRKLIVGLIAAALLIVMGVLLSMGWGKMMAAGDEDFLTSLVVTVFYAFGTVPIQLGLALLLAYVLFQNIRGKEFFRMIYFLPYITPVVSTAVVFRIIFNPRETSLANIVLGWLGIEPQKWLFEPRPLLEILGINLPGFWAGPSMALVTIILFGVWTFVGYNTVIFLAGLGSISKEIYEAAEIDGASGWDLFRSITFPLISPVTFYLFLISFIGTFKAFNHLYVMQTPSAQNTVQTASVEIFKIFYKANNYGYAAAQAIILFLIILGLTFAQNKLLGNKVFYG